MGLRVCPRVSDWTLPVSYLQTLLPPFRPRLPPALTLHRPYLMHGMCPCNSTPLVDWLACMSEVTNDRVCYSYIDWFDSCSLGGGGGLGSWSFPVTGNRPMRGSASAVER